MAAGGPPGAVRRGGKFKKYTRGGGKHFSRNLRPLDEDGNEIMPKRDSSGEESSEEDSSEEESSEEEEAKPTMTREERRAATKAKKEAAIARKKNTPAQPGDLPSNSEEEDSDDDMPANPNHSKASREQANSGPVTIEQVTAEAKNMAVSGPGKAVPESRRNEKEIRAQQAKERYQRLHEAGKTDEAKADLARLKVIRERREAEAARKQAEKEEREEAEKAKKAETQAREEKRREAAMGGAKGKGKAKK